MKIGLFILAALVVSVVTNANLVLAQPGADRYDTTKAVVMKATITKFEWGTPHNQIYYDVTDDKGSVRHWVVSTEPAPVMQELGWTRRSLKPGDVVTAYIYAAKNGEAIGNVQKFVLADGKELTTRGPAPGGATAQPEPAK